MITCSPTLNVFADLSGLTLSSSGKDMPEFSILHLGLCGRPSVSSCVCSPSVGPLLVKDEYDYDNQPSHSSSESHLQTIQHPPSRPGPQETFSSPSLLPPAEGSSSASTSAFSTISAGPSSETLHLDNTSKPNQNFVFTFVCCSYLFPKISKPTQNLTQMRRFLFTLTDPNPNWSRNNSFTPAVPQHQNGHLQHHPPMPHTGHYCKWTESSGPHI